MPSDPKIICDDDHRYYVRVDEVMREMPSVTTIMKDVGYYPWAFGVSRDKPEMEIKFPTEQEEELQHKLDTAAQRGTAVHQITEDLDRTGELPDEIAPELEPYIDAYLDFKNQNNLEITAIEEFVYNEEFWYAGALDRVMTINGVRAIVDLKTGQTACTTGVQLAAYLYAYQSMADNGEVTRFGLHLRPNGTYKLVPYKNNQDLANFLAAVRVYHYKRNL